ncbi:MAG: hypothetical protein VX262_02300 [Acidobacteriota bacterium]|nr:hypothetical protein [Acidobacteriota bacterium]
MPLSLWLHHPLLDRASVGVGVFMLRPVGITVLVLIKVMFGLKTTLVYTVWPGAASNRHRRPNEYAMCALGRIRLLMTLLRHGCNADSSN